MGKSIFELYPKESPNLFIVGEKGDICLKKKSLKDQSYCEQYTFNYKEKK